MELYVILWYSVAHFSDTENNEGRKSETNKYGSNSRNAKKKKKRKKRKKNGSEDCAAA